MTITSRLFTSLSICFALVWAAIAAVSVPTAFADDATLYRFERYKKEGSRITVWFQESGASRATGASLKLKFPVQLARKQKVVDGVVSEKTCLLAALRGDKATIFEIALGSNRKVLRVEEREPTAADQNFFIGLMEDGAAPQTGDSKGTGSVGVMGVVCPPGYSPTLVQEKRCHGTYCTTEWVTKCMPDPSSPPQPPNPQPPQPPAGNPCPGPGATQLCGSLTTGYNCCNPATQQCITQNGIGFCQDKQPPPPPPPSGPSCDAASQQTCGQGAGAWCCDIREFCGSAKGVCNTSPQPPPPLCEPSYQQTCGQGARTWCCSLTESCGSAYGQCTIDPPQPSGPCSATYSCRYTDGSTGSGTITCPPQANSVSGHWGSMDCKTCVTRFAPNCASGTTPPSGPPANPPPSCGPTGCATGPVLGAGSLAPPSGPPACTGNSCQNGGGFLIGSPKIRSRSR